MSFVIMEDETLRRIANIVGPQSAAARALDEAERQRALGIDAVIGSSGTCFSVCSRQFAEIRAASADTRPEGGDATEIAAPFTSGAVPEGQTPNPSHRSTGE